MKYILLLLLICPAFQYPLLGDDSVNNSTHDNPGANGSVVITESDIGATKQEPPPEEAEAFDSTVPEGTQKGADITLMANSKDWYLGLEYMYSINSIGVQLGPMFMVRPLRKSAFEKIGPYTYRQYQSRVFVFGIYADKDFLVYGGHGFYVRAGYGFTSTIYYGGKNPPSERTPILGGGYVFRNFLVDLRAGYQYTQIPQNPDNFIFMSAGLRL